MKVHKGKRSDHLIDEEDEEDQHAYEPQVEDDEYNLQRVVEGKGKGIATDQKAAQSLLDLQKPKKQICDTPSPADAKTGADTKKSNSKADTEILNVDEERGKDVSHILDLEERIDELDEG
ncbi:hypothetical protein Tco_0166588 [Tanacetum coccineum]